MSDQADAVTWLGHSTVVLDLDGVRLITDPLLGENPAPLRRRYPAPDPSLWQGTQAALISHLHHDHAELSSLRMLGDVPILSAPENAAWLRKRGLKGVDLGHAWTPLYSLINNPGADAAAHPGSPADEPEVRQTSAVHRHRPMPHRPNAANGHLIRTKNWRIYVVGDTSLFPGMAQIPQRLGGEPDLIVVPISGWGPRLSPGHMGPDEAARACAITGARHAIAVHWGTLHPPMMDRGRRSWMDAPLPKFADALRREAPGCTLIELPVGERWSPHGAR